MKKDEFKEFIKKNPSLISFVRNNEMTWQKFYEMYDLYGENSEVWNDYIKKEDSTATKSAINSTLTGVTLSEIINYFKKIDLDSLQESIGNVQRVLGVVQDFSRKDSKPEEKSTYKPRPLYKHFED